MPNIEIKARYPNQEKARKIANELKTEYVGIDHQVDTYFKTPKGRLKLRESSLSGAQLVPYIRPDQAGPKKSDYAVVPIQDPTLIKRLFSEIFGVEVVVDKQREIFLIDNVRVHIDNVTGLGNYFEFEAVYNTADNEKAEYDKVSELMKKFEISEEALEHGSYKELLSRK